MRTRREPIDKTIPPYYDALKGESKHACTTRPGHPVDRAGDFWTSRSRKLG
jgi:hypothetical protein